MKFTTAIISALAAVAAANPMPAEQGDVEARQAGGVRVVPQLTWQCRLTLENRLFARRLQLLFLRFAAAWVASTHGAQVISRWGYGLFALDISEQLLTMTEIFRNAFAIKMMHRISETPSRSALKRYVPSRILILFFFSFVFVVAGR
jgi:hypothetical protein